MPQLIALGTAASVPDAEHDTVALLLRGPGWAVPVDCGGSPLYKLARLGVDLDEIRAVVVTHRHADHLYGLPMLVQGLWLAGRQAPLPVYGPAETLDVARRLLALFSLNDRDDIFDLDWRPVPRRADRLVAEIGGVRIRPAPGLHGDVDVRAYRFDNPDTGRSIVYSADTEPCDAVADLAAGADLLLHEATGTHPGHSGPAEAAAIARQAGVGRLALIHYPVRGVNLDAWLGAAAAEFPGFVSLARDGDRYEL